MDDRKNWAGNITYSAQRFHVPTTIEQAQEIVRSCRKVRALGSRHSFNTIADSTADLLSLAQLDFNKEIAVDRDRHTVTVGGGVRYGHLCAGLHAQGYALHNLASLPHISVAGACATGTHGSGDGNGNLATAVSALEMIADDGEIVRLSRERDGERFRGAVVGLGAVGMVTRITLDVVPAFQMRQDLYLDLPLTAVEEHFDAITSSAYSVSLFTDWTAPRFNQVWLKSYVTDDAATEPQPEFYGATHATRPLHPIVSIPADNCTEQMGVPGPWYERLPHFRMEYTPSNGDELQTEYLLPRRHALAALRAVAELSAQIAPLLQISEIRTVADDDLWLSPCYGQACVGIHFTWQPNWPAVQALLPWIEAQLEPYEARPHWGKLFTLAPSRVRTLYPKWPDFQHLIDTCDPQGKFRNEFVDAYLAAK
jgi:alditol oxidase